MTKIDVSFLLPTNRAQTYPQILSTCIDSINAQHADISHEILVYSQDPVEGENVKWIQEEGRTGPIRGFNYMASELARGDYIACITDDQAIQNSIMECINVVEGPLYQDRVFKIIGINCGGRQALSQDCPIPNRGKNFGHSVISEYLPNAFTLRYPVVRKDTLSQHLSNHIFHPDLFYHAGDIWLGYFLCCNAEPSWEGPTALMDIARLKDNITEVEDCDTVYKLIKNHIAGCPDYIPSDY
tara:strand:+ start:978 stop:1700 length:723 start_codon:yes stop_codon:yes gene_type:complete